MICDTMSYHVSKKKLVVCYASDSTTVSRKCSLVVYSDSTNCDQLGRKSEHPLSITLGNIPEWHRQKLDARTIIAYLPKMTSTSHNNDNTFHLKKLQMFHNYLHKIFTLIVNMQQTQKGFEI